MDYLISFYSIIDYIGLFPLLKSVTRTEIQRLWISDFAHKKRKKKKSAARRSQNSPEMRRREQSSRCRSNMNHCVKSCCVRPSQENHLIDLVFGWGQKRQLIVCVWVTSYMIPTSLMFNSFFLKAEKKNPGLKKKNKNTHIVSPLLSCKTIIVSR